MEGWEQMVRVGIIAYHSHSVMCRLFYLGPKSERNLMLWNPIFTYSLSGSIFLHKVIISFSSRLNTKQRFDFCNLPICQAVYSRSMGGCRVDINMDIWIILYIGNPLRIPGIGSSVNHDHIAFCATGPFQNPLPMTFII